MLRLFAGDGAARQLFGKPLRLLVSLFALFGSSAFAAEALLSWTDNSTNEVGFNVERSADGQNWTPIGATVADVATYVDATVEAGVSYSYRVNAFNEFGSSGYTNLATYYRNLAPTISAIGDLELAENETSAPIGFTLGDQETIAAELSVVFESSNTNLFDASSAVFEGTGASRTLTLTPLTNRFGTALITVTVDDGQDTAVAQFTVNVTEFVPPSIDLKLSFLAGSARVGEPFEASITSLDISQFESVTYTLDGVSVGSSVASPFAVTVTPSSEGSHTLQAIAQVAGRATVSESSMVVSVGPAPTEQEIVDSIRSQSIDETSQNGSMSYDLATDTFTLTDDVGEISGSADSSQFSSLMVSGDLDLRVELVALNESSSQSVAGLMLRSALYGKSVQSSLLIGADGRVELRERSVRGGSTSSQVLDSGASGYSRLRIARLGSELNFYASTDGQTWVPLASRTTPVGSDCFAGLTLAAGTSGSEASAVFGKFDLQGAVRIWPEDAAAPGVPSNLILTNVD